MRPASIPSIGAAASASGSITAARFGPPPIFFRSSRVSEELNNPRARLPISVTTTEGQSTPDMLVAGEIEIRAQCLGNCDHGDMYGQAAGPIRQLARIREIVTDAPPSAARRSATA